MNEAINSHETEHHKNTKPSTGATPQTTCTAGELLQRKIDVVLSGPSPVQQPSTITTIGPYKITNPNHASSIREGAWIAYMVVALVTALIGPKTLFLTMWRIAVLLTVYAVVRQQQGWDDDDDEATDVILEMPVVFIAALANFGLEFLEVVVAALAPVAAQAAKAAREESDDY